jgi:hypothetical protein
MSDVKLWCPDDGGMVRAYRAEGMFAPLDQEYSNASLFIAKPDYDALAAENAALRELIFDHNEGCRLSCGESAKELPPLCEAYVMRDKRCPTCPIDDIIDLPETSP